MPAGLDQLGFHPMVVKWFAEKFAKPTAAQRRGWPAIVAGEDTLVAAPTGSGKTFAAFLSCIDNLIRKAQQQQLQNRTYVVYVSPLRALSNDIERNLSGPLEELTTRAALEGRGLADIRVGLRTGDTPQSVRRKQVKKRPHILVTTPESLYILLTSQSGREALGGVETVIVDEIHAIAPDRRGAHLSLTLERLDALVRGAQDTDKRPQRIGLSATQKPIDEVARFLTGGRPCTIIDEGHARKLDLALRVPDGEVGAVCTHEQWDDVFDQIAQLVKEHETTIVFTNTRRLVERVAHALTERLGEDAVGAHHGSMSRLKRLDIEQKLKTAQLRVVVATASLQLGIDVGTVELVCQLGSPRSIATLLQRVGRAGHALQATPKGRVFALTRDDLVDCTALMRAVRGGRLDALSVPENSLDVLAQQLVATCVGSDWAIDDLYKLATAAYPYRNLRRETFDEVLTMLADGFATRHGRRSAYLHRDRINNRVRDRRSARLAAITSGGAIPEKADYQVVADPEGLRVGTLDEDFAIESMPGDIFLLGNMSWRITRVETGRVRVVDAHGQPPSIPFWFGEAPGRTAELSEEVSELRSQLEARLSDTEAALAWLEDECGVSADIGKQLLAYFAAAHAALGCLPTRTRIVAERFFDEAGGMQLVIHAPFGSRLNRAWGLTLRKRFCRTFDFELQAAATDDGILLSLGPQHSFPLDSIFHYVPSRDARHILEQAALQAPVFATRWRWVTTRALAVLRFAGGKRVAPFIQRMRADDLLAAVFPDQAGCQDNHTGAIKPPDHPLVNQALLDCLEEAMDAQGLVDLLQRIEGGDIELVARGTPEPSPFAHEILSANPYAFLDDAPLEERRTRAVSVRRGLPAETAKDMGALDAAAIATVRQDAWPHVRSADELHDALCLLGALPQQDTGDQEAEWLAELITDNRATRLHVGDGGQCVWVAAETLALGLSAYGDAARLDPTIAPAPGVATVTRQAAITTLVRGRLESTGPTTEAKLAALLFLSASDVAIACAQLESEGSILRGTFSPDAHGPQWCDRRLLSRIHRLTLGRLRKEIEPVAPAMFARFLLRWQHLAPGTQLFGARGLSAVIAQIQGAEAAVSAWERDILPARVSGFLPAQLDELCYAGEIVWGRRGTGTGRITTRATPISLWHRASSPWMLAMTGAPDEPLNTAGAREVLDVLERRGALFYDDIVDAVGLSRTQLDAALWALVSSGQITADGFSALRTLASESPRRSGRWSLLRKTAADGDDDKLIEQHARQLLARYGVVYRELVRKDIGPRWRSLLLCYRRLEARGQLRGGRFVAGAVGEQFATPEAIDALRAVRRTTSPGDPCATDDPLLSRAFAAANLLPEAPSEDAASA